MNHGGSPKFETGLAVSVSVIESKMPGFPPRAVVARANFISDFRQAEIITHVCICRLSAASLANNYQGRLIVSADEKQNCSWSEVVRSTRIKSSKNILVTDAYRCCAGGSLGRAFENEI